MNNPQADKFASLAGEALDIARVFDAEGQSHLAQKCVALARAYMRLSVSARCLLQVQKECD